MKGKITSIWFEGMRLLGDEPLFSLSSEKNHLKKSYHPTTIIKHLFIYSLYAHQGDYSVICIIENIK